MKKLNRTFPTLDEYSKKAAGSPLLCGGYRTRRHASARSDIPLVSIITVTYNAEKTLLRTLDSVRAQTYQNIEHIIIDGGSTDGTLGLIQGEEDAIAYWCSERDHGIYDAFNKGVALATGEYIGILNADDYYEPSQLENAVAALIKSGAPFVHGDIILHGWQGQDVELLGDPHYELKIKERMPSLHQVTTLCRRSVFQRYGLFSTKYRIAGDFDWYLRLANQGCIGVHVPSVRAHMAAGGISTTQQRRAFFEALMITWRHGLGLTRALRVTLPRIIFPNGAPESLKHIARASRDPLSAFAHVCKRSSARNGSNDSDVINNSGNRLPLIQAFVAARHLTLNLDSLGLEWIYGVGLRSRTFVSYSKISEAAAAELLLTAAGSSRAERTEDADVLIIDKEQADKFCTGQILERKTILVAIGENSLANSHFSFSSLDFGGVAGCGVLINPALTLR